MLPKKLSGILPALKWLSIITVAPALFMTAFEDKPIIKMVGVLVVTAVFYAGLFGLLACISHLEPNEDDYQTWDEFQDAIQKKSKLILTLAIGGFATLCLGFDLLLDHVEIIRIGVAAYDNASYALN
jgi:hypothetical protein